jgi:Ni,Fe-hydrogenase I cytochrome b subunit
MNTNLTDTAENTYYAVAAPLPLWIWLPVLVALVACVAISGFYVYKHFKKKNSN